ncbi:MAG: TatD family hydrolase [Oligoflexia bacterium]|nr:TatD family hydrolase [Oligoflexia bacterium]
MKPEFIDTHVHIASAEFDCDRDLVIQRAQEAGVRRFVCIGAGTGLDSAQQAVALAERHPFIWASVGVHPHDADRDVDKKALETLCAHPRVVAIGETGLDFHYDFAPRARQEAWFIAQIELARAHKKPLIIHSRLAGKECLAILKQHSASEVGGVFHCYSEDAAFAAELAKINFLVSLPGIITFKNAEALRKTVKDIPLEQIMLETDAPFLAPIPYRGKRCESSFLPHTAQTLADIKGLPIEEIATITTKNAERFFKL